MTEDRARAYLDGRSSHADGPPVGATVHVSTRPKSANVPKGFKWSWRAASGTIHKAEGTLAQLADWCESMFAEPHVWLSVLVTAADSDPSGRAVYGFAVRAGERR